MQTVTTAAYFATAVTYDRKVFVKLFHGIKLILENLIKCLCFKTFKKVQVLSLSNLRASYNKKLVRLALNRFLA